MDKATLERYRRTARDMQNDKARKALDNIKKTTERNKAISNARVEGWTRRFHTAAGRLQK